MEYKIVQLNKENAGELPKSQEPFTVFGSLVPLYDGHKWTYKEEILQEPHEKTYPNESFDPAEYIDCDYQVAFLAMCGEKCVGSIRVCKRWNGGGFIDDLAIDRAHRHCGVGHMLMDRAVSWCHENELNGLSLETQDDNLAACRFYIGYGFELGGIDIKCYTDEAYRDETALYFYLNDNVYNN